MFGVFVAKKERERSSQTLRIQVPFEKVGLGWLLRVQSYLLRRYDWIPRESTIHQSNGCHGAIGVTSNGNNEVTRKQRETDSHPPGPPDQGFSTPNFVFFLA